MQPTLPRRSEQQRLQSLRAFQILDTDPSAGFDRLTRLAVDLFSVPAAAISLVDENRLWFKSFTGFPLREVPREASFCDATILGERPLVVGDTRLDLRFAANRVVVGDPEIRFYAGAPLTVSSGCSLGAFCLFDLKPRSLSAEEVRMLEDLAALAVDQIWLHRKREELEERNYRLSTNRRHRDQMARLAKVGAWAIDCETGALNWSPEIYRMHDVPRDFRPTLPSALQFYEEPGRSQLRQLIKRAIETHESFEFEMPIISAKGERRWLRSIGEVETRSGRPRTIVSSVQDVTDQHQNAEQLRYLASHDALTGLANRGRFTGELDAVLAHARRGEAVAVILLDVDNFKDINDTSGHDCGDTVLLKIAERLNASLGLLDHPHLIARLGGDEFAILIRNLEKAWDVVPIAQGLLDEISQPIETESEKLHATASMGIALFPDDGATSHILMKAADLALYHSKREGRARFSFFTKTMMNAAEQRRAVIEEARLGLEHDEFVVFYQPIIRFCDRSVAGFEALVRWNHPRLGLISPGQFLAALNDEQIGGRISQEVIRKVAAQLGRWSALGLDPGTVAINVTSGQLRNPSFVETLTETLAAHRIAPRRIKLEITEGVLMGRAAAAVATVLKTLRQAGCCIALDDFGTGYASLIHLNQFPLDQLKIDISFVQQLRESRDVRAIVRTITHLAHELGAEVVAEGIETPETEAIVMGLGCDFGQGFRYEKALPAERIAGFLAGWSPASVSEQSPSMGYLRSIAR